MDIHEQLRALFRSALARCVADGVFAGELPDVVLDRPKRPEHGDFSLNLALVLAKRAKRKPRDLAQVIVDAVEDGDGLLASTDIAGPGFINVRLSEDVWRRALGQILAAGDTYGAGPARATPRILLEYVSANPTGPIHVGHGRGAVCGDALARLLRLAGFPVTTEYYLNDAGSQVRKLALSIRARALQILRQKDPSRAEVPFPEDGYPGDYVIPVAERYLEAHGELDTDEPDDATLEQLERFGVEEIRRAIEATLARMKIHFDVWYSERSLHDDGALHRAVDRLRDAGYVDERDGAQWFRSTDFGDEKDRVVIRDTGQPTYFAADIAYHIDKYERGFDHLINIWGADHHGYVPRMKGAVQALGRAPESLELLLVQFVSLLRAGRKVQQGKRLGEFVTVDDLLDQVGADVARYFFLDRRFDAHVDFDLEVAVSEDPRVNPAKYAQYGHARACRILAKAGEELGYDVPAFDLELARHLTHPDEVAILRQLAEFPPLVQAAAEAREPHRLVTFLHDLARAFQSYYTRLRREKDPVLPPASARTDGWEERWDIPKMQARLMWVDAFRQVSRNALTVLGLESPESMERLDDSEQEGEDDDA